MTTATETSPAAITATEVTPADNAYDAWDVTVRVGDVVGAVTLAPASWDGRPAAPEGAGGRDGWMDGALCRLCDAADDGRVLADEIEAAAAAAVRRSGVSPSAAMTDDDR